MPRSPEAVFTEAQIYASSTYVGSTDRLGCDLKQLRTDCLHGVGDCEGELQRWSKGSNLFLELSAVVPSLYILKMLGSSILA